MYQIFLEFANVYWNILKCSPIQSVILGRRYVPILNKFLWFFKNQTFVGLEPPEGLEIVPENGAIFFLKSVN